MSSVDNWDSPGTVIREVAYGKERAERFGPADAAAMNDDPVIPDPPRPGNAAANRRGTPFETSAGHTLFLRPIRPDDVDALRRGFARLTPEQVRLRVFHRMNDLAPEVAARLCNVDATEGAAFVVTDADGEIRGEARMYVDRTAESAEFALIVDPTLVGIGVGHALMQRLFEEGRRRGLSELCGSVLAANATMLDFASGLGAQREAVAGEPDMVRIRLDLGGRCRED